MTIVRAASADDAKAIAAIYNHYINNTSVTFEEQAIDQAAIVERMAAVSAAGLPWLVAVEDNKVLGYSYAGRWHVRSAYRFCAESTVYLDSTSTGRGLGTQLYSALLAKLTERGIHTAIGGIALPNEASVRLHEKLGFVKVSHFKEVGFKFNRWVDVGHWQFSVSS